MSNESGTPLSRSVDVIRIPSGEQITLPEGTHVVITQALGSAFTLLIPAQAGLFRLEGSDADAIGREVPKSEESTTPPADLEQAVWACLKSCFDPEIPVNIVDLGLIYGMSVEKAADENSNVQVQMTLTAPGCGMGPIIASEARQKILALEGVSEASVDLVWEPAWTPERISEEGRQKLGMV
ncbi:MAG: iron-sulfur cluster assembly protein [Chthoniobacterales bacterium]